MGPIVLRARWVVIAVAAVLLFACGGTDNCRPEACAEGTVCDLDGTCRPLSERREAAFAQAQRLRPTRWGATRRDRPTLEDGALDEALLGGPMSGTLYLAFALPQDARVVSAVLTLSTAADDAPGDPQLVRAFALRSLEAPISRRTAPGRGPAGAGRFANPSGAFHLDITELARRAARRREPLSIGVEAEEAAALPWRIASPTALESARRPHLDLRLIRLD